MKTPGGRCSNCGKEFSARGMSRHLNSCLGPGRHLHLRVFNAHNPLWWLHLSVDPAATLRDVDALLRRTWLECCGHLSTFDIDGVTFDAEGLDLGWGDAPRPMSVKAVSVLSKGTKLRHTYDFGSSTELSGVVAGLVAGGTKEPVALLAQNNTIPWTCDAECEAPATRVCMHCREMACADHADPDGYCPGCDEPWEYYSLPVVNSPRMGVCGYEG